MRFLPVTTAVVAASLALGLGGAAVAAEEAPAPGADAAVAGVTAGLADEFEAFDDCLREQGVDLPEMPDLPPPDQELTDEQIAELDALEDEAIDVEISDEAWDACEQHLPEGAEMNDEAFAEFDQCLADNGVDIDEPVDGHEEDAESPPSDADIEAEMAEMDAAFEKCEEHLPEGALIDGELGELDEEAFAEFDQCLADNGINVDEAIEAPEGDEAEIDAAFDKCEQHLPKGAIVEGPATGAEAANEG